MLSKLFFYVVSTSKIEKINTFILRPLVGLVELALEGPRLVLVKRSVKEVSKKA